MIWPFRILIATLMAFVVMILIVSAINYFNNYKIQVSMERIANGFGNAWGTIVEKPSDSGGNYKGLVREKDLMIPTHTFTSRFFADKFNLDSECVEMQAKESSAFEVSSSGRSVTVKQSTLTDVYFLCFYRKTTVCPEYCIVSFGKRPDF